MEEIASTGKAWETFIDNNLEKEGMRRRRNSSDWAPTYKLAQLSLHSVAQPEPNECQRLDAMATSRQAWHNRRYANKNTIIWARRISSSKAWRVTLSVRWPTICACIWSYG